MKPFLLEQIHRSCARGGVNAQIGDGVEPGAALGIEILQGVEGASGQKVIFYITNHSLDLSLGAWAVGTMSSWLKAVIVGKITEARIDQAGPHDHLAHVVIEDALWPSAKVGEGVLMAADEALQAHGASELDVERPAKAQDHDEEENACPGAVGKLIATGFGPIGLCLFARRSFETGGKFRGHLAAQPIKES